MTDFSKPVSRVTVGEYKTVYPAKPRKLVVRLVDDRIEFRELRRRLRWSITVEAAARFAFEKPFGLWSRKGGNP